MADGQSHSINQLEPVASFSINFFYGQLIYSFDPSLMGLSFFSHLMTFLLIVRNVTKNNY